ncbi:Retrovirus-related Pol polyprotein from transposon [Sesamum angolense]|uniref:Retrovirus-related Pol polyprotein from transposon n=1 Tax=Sesamum angolense TaxID=2727404 RepID=A0AAE1W427_9LAMI|nr:Retrovirus-related Pol polyprotein from transposon [Sesamum angolense]
MSVDKNDEIVFGEGDWDVNEGSENNPIVIRMDIANFMVHKVLVDNGSFVDILFMDVLRKMEIGFASLRPVSTPLIEFGVVSTFHLKIKFPTTHGVEEVKCNQKDAWRCYNLSIKKGVEKRSEHQGQPIADPQDAKQVKQKKRSFGTERNRIIEEEVDLNKACPEDPYPLPRIDLLVDSTAGCALFSLMDAYQGYHQIFIAKEDRDKTSFITVNGIYCYNVMPFGLKNAGATYQRLVNKMFKDLIEKNMEVPREENTRAGALSMFGALGGIQKDEKTFVKCLGQENAKYVLREIHEEELPGVLWAYQTTLRTTIGETPFCLVYGSEEVITIEIGKENN